MKLLGKVWLLALLSLSAPLSWSASEPHLKGNWKQGGIIFGKATPGSKVSLDGRQLRLASTGEFVFGLDRDAPETAILQVTGVNGAQQFEYPVAQRDYQIQHIEGVEQKHVTPPKEVAERITREAGLVRAARTRDDQRSDFLQSFQWPVSGRITGVYGSQRVYNGVPRSPHFGLDIAAPTGTKVMAPAAGVVTFAHPDLYFSGGTLILDHGHGLSSTFIHLSKVLVRDGDKIAQGQPIAEVGATGRATGPHLDWRMNWFGVRVDPQLLMEGKPMPEHDR